MVKLAVIGLGGRGRCNIQTLCSIEDVAIISVCDPYEDRVAKTVEDLKKRGHEAQGFTDYKKALNVPGLDAVMIASGWQSHSQVALYALEKGIPVGCEVGGEYSLERCFELVRTQEKTGTPYMFLENCCYGEEELLATAMVRRGKLGKISFCAGAYTHDLRDEVSYGIKNRHYRFENYHRRNCDNYPTHDLGPIAKLLNINRGNRIVSLTSLSSAANGLSAYIAGREDADEVMKNTVFKQGDVVETLLTCANGELIRLHLDTTLPTAYNRDFTVRGTKGSYYQATNSFFFDGDKESWIPWESARDNLNNAQNYREFLPDIWKNITEEERKKGHGGMDYFCFKAFVAAVKEHKPMPIDVYDAAVWMAVSVLSEQSILSGGAVQLMPDFTHGDWITRTPKDVVEL